MNSKTQTRAILPFLLRVCAAPSTESVMHPSIESLLRPPSELSLVPDATQTVWPQLVGTEPLFLGQRIYRGSDSDWVLMPLAEDPLYRDQDGFPVPQQVLVQLRSLAEAGIEFDALYVAHEIEKGAKWEGALAVKSLIAPPPSQDSQRLASSLGKVTQSAWEKALAPLRTSAKIGAAMGGLALGTVPLAVAAVALDPMLFGAVVDQGRPIQPGEPATWFFLGAWRYD